MTTIPYTEIGKTFVLDGKTYKVVPEFSGCSCCDIKAQGLCSNGISNKHCCAPDRIDKKGVVYQLQDTMAENLSAARLEIERLKKIEAAAKMVIKDMDITSAGSCRDDLCKYCYANLKNKQCSFFILRKAVQA